MYIILAACVSFAGIWFLLTHLPSRWMRRLVGYKGWVDLALHGSVIMLFFGTSTLGLLQAELAAIMFSVSLRIYRKLFGYEKLQRRGAKFVWMRYAGAIKR